LKEFKDSEAYKCGNLNIYADIENNTIGGGTVPPDIVATSQKPDIVLFWPTDKKVTLFELSVPFEPNITKAHQIKLNRYASLVSDIKNANFDCSLIAVEVGSRGLIDGDNKSRLTYLSKQLKCSTNYTQLKNNISKSALISSYSIFNGRQGRHETEWNVNETM